MSLSQSHEIPAPIADDVSGDHHAGAHAVPRRILLGVYGALLVLTVITVAVAQLDLGNFNIWVALLVAVIKGGLVAMYFMHLRWDSPFNGLILISALFFVSLFIGIAMLDAHSYEVNMQMPPEIPVTPEKPAKEADTGPTIATILGTSTFHDAAKRAQILDAVTAEHGDAREGEQLFTKQGCIACHTVRKSDPLKGPCLVDVAKKYKRRDLAENIIDPNMKIADGFITFHYKMNDGNVNEGFMVSQTPDKIVLRTIAGQLITIDPSDVEKSKQLTTSPMPEGIVNTLTIKQFASILDYLQAIGGVQ